MENPYGPSPEPSNSRFRVPRPAVTAGLVAFFAMAGAGIAFAVDGSGSSTPSGDPSSAQPAAASGTTTTTVPGAPHSLGRGHMKFGPMGIPGAGGPGGRVLYGRYTVEVPPAEGSSAAPTYKTIDVQTGTVDTVSGTSIEVTSADGHQQTYTVDPSTVVDSQAGGISAVSAKDVVRIEAVEQGSTLTATNIVDQTKIGASRQGFGFGPGGPEDGATPPQPSSPTPTQGSTSA